MSIDELVAASALETDSVEGQRSRPSAVMRLDLLKVVGSRPERLASPEGDMPARSASRSSAVQTWLWVRMRCALECFAIENLVNRLGIIASFRRFRANLRAAPDAAALELAACRLYGRPPPRPFRENPNRLNDKPGTPCRDHL